MTLAQRKRLLMKASPWLLLLFLGLFWELLCFAFQIPDYLFPAPTDIWRSWLEYRPQIIEHATQTLFTTVVGFALAVVVGTLTGLVLAEVSALRRAVRLGSD